MYLLTGSANILTLGKVSETLAGRVAVFELLPFCWAEKESRPLPLTLSTIFQASNASDLLKKLGPRKQKNNLQEKAAGLIVKGGYPTPSLMSSDTARRQWFSSYRTTYIDRDLRDLASISYLPDFGRLLRVSAMRTGQLLNLSDISREIGLPFTTLRRYLNLLRLTYQVFLLPPYHVNIGKRLVKTPKLYFSDTAMALNLMGISSWKSVEELGRSGFLVETWAYLEIRKLILASDPAIGFYFWRTSTSHEVDFVLEREQKLVAIEVKYSKRISNSDLAGLKEFGQLLKGRVHIKILLYAGDEPIGVDSSTVALPFDTFFGTQP